MFELGFLAVVVVELQEFLSILDGNPLSDTRFASTSSHFTGCLFTLLPVSFDVLNFDAIQFIYFSFLLPVLWCHVCFKDVPTTLSLEPRPNRTSQFLVPPGIPLAPAWLPATGQVLPGHCRFLLWFPPWLLLTHRATGLGCRRDLNGLGAPWPCGPTLSARLPGFLHSQQHQQSAAD